MIFAQESPVLAPTIPWSSTILNLLVIFFGIVLIFLVLIQRGKGGGLSGAFGGVGGSSAFGSRAGDLFTRITLVVAGLWILIIMVHVKVVQASRPGAATVMEQPAEEPDGGQ